MAQLTCHDLAVGYDGNAVLQGLNFEVRAGDYLLHRREKTARQEYPL